MKAAGFDYIRAESVDQVCAALADADGDARVIAGGQTLVPLMAMRLARPATLIDINDLAELSGITRDGDCLVIKSCTRQAETLASSLVAECLPILSEALSHVGHTQTRNRGTVGGSLVNADPSAEIPLVAQLLEAEMVARSIRGERTIEAAAFFESAMATSLEEDECLIEVRFPIWSDAQTGFGFHEISIRDSDFALASAAAQIALDSTGNCTRLHLAIGGATPAPARLDPIEQALTGTTLSDDDIAEATAAIPDMVEPQSDVHASDSYRRRVVRVLAERAIRDARDMAKEART